MTEARPPCPPAEQLLDFAGGRLADGAAAAVEAHIDACGTCRATLSSLAKGDAPARSFGRYKLETVLGAGGMGIVYRAWDPQLARAVAIKVVRSAGDDAALRARLVREAQSLARLSHANVCHVYDVGTDGGEVWVAMELIDGTTLRQWASTPRPQAELLAVLLGAADGIAAAHASGLIHRDIKPENVLVTREGRPVVTDFGLARVDIPVDPTGSTISGDDPQLTVTGAIAGTPAYLAPEQLTGDALDARVDQFAWAVMAWELLTGVRPFPAIAAVRLEAIRAGLTPPPALPRAVAAALARAMAIAPRDRFPSMRELIAALRDRPATAGTSRVPLLVGASAALAIGATVLAWQALRDDERALAGAGRSADVIAAYPSAERTAPAELRTTSSEVRTPPDAPTVEMRTTVAADRTDRTDRADRTDRTSVPDSPPDARVDTGAPPGVRPRATVKATSPAAAPATRHATRDDGASSPSTATAPPVRGLAPFSRTRAEATLAFCKLPIDPAKPDPAYGRGQILDWGRITRRELVRATFLDRDEQLFLYEARGARGTYRFEGGQHSNTLGMLDVQPGQLVVLCEGTREPSELHKLPPAWGTSLNLMDAVLPVSEPPRLAQIAKLAPLHVDAARLRRDGSNGQITLATDRRYLVLATVRAADGARWDMDDWWLEVPAGVPGAQLVGAGARLWFVVEKPALEQHPNGKQPRLVLRAAHVQAEMFVP